MKRWLVYWIAPLGFMLSCYPEVPILDCIDNFRIIVLDTRNSECGVSTGSITITSEGGSGAIEYQLDNGAYQSLGEFGSLVPDIYLLNARDEKFCAASTEITIVSEISFQISIKPIFDTHCNIPTCHDGSSIDFRIFANIQARLPSIKGLTESGEMPKNSILHASDIEKIICWIDAGALDN